MWRLSLSETRARAASAGLSPRSSRNVRRPRVEELETRQLLAATLSAFPLPSSSGAISNPVVGGDGNLWFTENQGNAPAANAVVQVTPSGSVTELPLPAGHFTTGALTVDQNGNLWGPGYAITSSGVSRTIDEITPDISNGLALTEYSVPSATNSFLSSTMTLGADGNIWVLQDTLDATGAEHTVTVDRITTDGSGTITAFPAPGATVQESLTRGPEGNLWISDGGELASVTPDGTVTPVPLPDYGMAYLATPEMREGVLWVPYLGISTGVGLAKVTMDGRVTTIPLPNVTTLTEGGDANLWFTQSVPGSGTTTFGYIATNGSNAVTTLSTTLSGQILEPGTGQWDGRLYYLEQSSGTQGPAIVDLSQDGANTITEMPLRPPAPGGTFAPSPSGTPDVVHGLTSGSDGNFWFVNEANGTIGKLDLVAPGDDPVGISPFPDPVFPDPGSGPYYLLPGIYVSTGVGLGVPASLNGSGLASGLSIESVARVGVRLQPTTLTVTFNVGLTPSQASNVKNYSLVLTGPRGHSRPHAKGIAIKLAVYDAAKHTVTLTPAHRLPLGLYFKLTINSAKLGAESVGTPGSNFVTLMHKFGPVMPKTAPAHHAAKHGHGK